MQAIKDVRVAAVLLAGGQGSRLGFNHPKGMLNIGINKTIYLFEILINNLLQIYKIINCWIPLYTMTILN
ncbi:MAG TPA: hypothetical protein DDZ99_09645 [Clostridiales bacterium]|nr:hypothetical protein [Clostridiales bacterium]